MHWVLVLILALAYAYAAPVYQLENLQRTNVGYIGDLELQSGRYVQIELIFITITVVPMAVIFAVLNSK
jgi:hypothetical protein